MTNDTEVATSTSSLRSSVTRALDLFQQHQDGKLNSFWVKTHLNPDDLALVWEHLKNHPRLQNYVANEIR